MSDRLRTLEVAETVPSWFADMDFCHVFAPDDPMERLYCGAANMGETPACEGEYDGEAICSSCGLPTCPRCAQLSALEDALDE